MPCALPPCQALITRVPRRTGYFCGQIRMPAGRITPVVPARGTERRASMEGGVSKRCPPVHGPPCGRLRSVAGRRLQPECASTLRGHSISKTGHAREYSCSIDKSLFGRFYRAGKLFSAPKSGCSDYREASGQRSIHASHEHGKLVHHLECARYSQLSESREPREFSRVWNHYAAWHGVRSDLKP